MNNEIFIHCGDGFRFSTKTGEVQRKKTRGRLYLPASWHSTREYVTKYQLDGRGRLEQATLTKI